MRARLVFALLVALYAVSPFLRGEDPLARMGGTVMEGVFFQGGYGLEWIHAAADEFERAHPDVSAYVWGNPRAWDQTRPRFLSGSPPDVFWGIHNINFWVNLEDGLVAELDSLMDEPAYGQEHLRFGDTFFPGSLEEGKYGGVQYFLPISYAVLGIWYNKGMFDEHGWTVPATWNEFLDLCALIVETSDVAPITHQGRAPVYYGFIYRGLVYNLGGNQLVCDLDSLVPGAWTRPEMVRAARLCRELVELGYILEGSSSFSHTESQMIWLQGKAAMLPCGTWLESEMKHALPEGFQMRIMPVPGFRDGVGGVGAIEASSGPAFWVPREGDQARWGMEYLRILLSKKMAANFLQTVGCLQPIAGSTEGVGVPAALQSALDAVAAAKGEVFNFRYPNYYLEMEQEFRNAFGSLLNGVISPEEFAARMESQAERLRRDPDTIRFKRVPTPTVVSG